MFMRFRGGGVGHIGTRYLDSRMKDDNNDSSHEQQEDSEETIADMYEDSDSYPQEERGDGVEEDTGRHEEHISRREPSNEETEDEDDKDEDEDESEDEEQEVSGNMNDEQDFDDDLEDEEIMGDDGILDEEGFAEL
jgi:hypothetical protein